MCPNRRMTLMVQHLHDSDISCEPALRETYQQFVQLQMHIEKHSPWQMNREMKSLDGFTKGDQGSGQEIVFFGSLSRKSRRSYPSNAILCRQNMVQPFPRSMGVRTRP